MGVLMRFVPLIFGALFVLCTPLFAQETLSYDEYEQMLSEQLSLDQKYREQIAQEQALISQYKNKIVESKKRIEEIQQKKLSIIGSTAEQVQSISEKLRIVENDCASLSKMSDSQFIIENSRLNNIQLLIDTLQIDPAARLPSIKKKLKEILQLLSICQMRAAELNRPVANNVTIVTSLPKEDSGMETYVVGRSTKRSETLYGISAKVYNDPLKWSIIYRANKEKIDDNFKKLSPSEKTSAIIHPSDLILPGQVLQIPR
jgi:nucleoid-associated protein YgaU